MGQLRAIKTFIAVADAGSLSAAARVLSISPPSVTRIIRDLEALLGVTLFHRTTRVVAMTEVGRTYLEDVRKIVEDIHEADDAARGAYRAPVGLLRLTASVIFGQHYISPIVMSYLDLYPEVAVEAVYLDRVVHILEEGFDIAVRIGPLPDSNLKAVRIGEVRRVICGNSSYFEKNGLPQVPADLANHSIVTARTATPATEWNFADGSKLQIKSRLSFSSVPAAIEVAKSGWGLTRVLSYQVGPELGSGELTTVLRDFEPEPLPIHLLHSEGRQSSAKVRAFIDLAAERLRADQHLS